MDEEGRTAGSCPIAQAIVELSFLSGPVREAAAAAKSVWRQTLIMLIRVRSTSDTYCTNTDVAQLGVGLARIYLSQHVSSHSLRDPTRTKRHSFP